ncbi:T9SS type B sorting domain-containing protein [Adhaeribacter soli]|uniref:Gliding motility-associated C-terminal domain-containing protein n=1 Tax=Adhaeribacter soli TaxID=2607655 RepID=A0A5N1IRM8_9BACT|nr:gliding motility-associated C-terminal domain-containing protein [Adhaeribacter soli]KAA9332660.1 gliding motility-associated C-terminal domain-containing protein [Adhaeribacter soli]
MRIKSLLKVFFILLLATVVNHSSKASHLFGGEFTYEYIGPSGDPTNPFQYKITYKIYREQNNGSLVDFRFYQKNGTEIPVTSLINMNGSPAPDLGFGAGITRDFTSQSPGPISLPTPPGCSITGLPSIRLWIYEYKVNLPISFNGYYATASIGARNGTITNLLSPGSRSLFTYMEIPSPLIPSKSPVFTDTAVVVIFAGDTTSIINSAFDTDGDKLIYSFNQPFDDGNYNTFIPTSTVPIRIPYVSTDYSVNNPFGTGGYASLNASTGLAKYYAPAAGFYVVSFQVKEYRNINGVDVQIGSTIRDIQIVVKNVTLTPNVKPTFTGPRVITITEGDAIPVTNFTFNDSEATPGGTQRMKVSVSSPLFDGPGNKNATFNGLSGSSTSNVLNFSNITTGTSFPLTFTSVCGEANTYPVNITVEDNNCPPGKRSETIQIEVVKYKGPERIFGDTTVCTGTNEAYNVTSKATANYNWRLQGGGTFVGSRTNPNVQVNWTTPGRYKLTAIETGTGTCRDSVSFFVNVGLGLNVTVNAPAPVCAGTPVTLTAAGATSYTWTDGTNTFTGTNVTVSPTTTTTYTVVGAGGTGCTGTNTVTVTVTPPPAVNAGTDRTICVGASTTLTASGAATYTWTDGTNTFTGNNVAVNPTTNTTYTVTGLNANGCSSTDQVTVTVTPGPVVNAGTDKTICAGSATTLTATGAGSYSWTDGTNTFTGASVTVTPTATTTYTVTGTTAGSCTGNDQVTVTVLPRPVLAVSSQSICAGQTATLTATGANSYSWTDGTNTFTGNSITVNPTATTTYTVTGTDAGNCTATAQLTVTVNPLPNVDAGASREICAGTSTTLTATGAAVFSWNDGSTTFTGNNISVTPATTTTYTVTGTNASGCTSTDQVTITVKPSPTVSLATVPNSLCKNAAPVTLPANSTINGIVASTLDPATLSVGNHTVLTSVTVNGCTGTATKTVTIEAVPAPSLAVLANSYCAGQAAVTLPAGTTINGNPAATFDPSVLGVGTYPVSLTETNAAGCTVTTNKTVTINATPAPSLSFLNNNYCVNAPAVNLPAGAGITYAINSGPAVPSGTFNPGTLGAGNHTVTITENNGSCSATVTKTIAVNALPTPSLALLASNYCKNEAAVTLPAGTTINGNPAGSFDPGTLAAGTYTVALSETNAAGCNASVSKTVTINAVPAPSLAFLNTAYCQTATAVTLDPAQGTYTINGVAPAGNSFNPAVLGPGTHTVMVTKIENGCTGTATRTIQVNAVPTADFGPLKNTYCANEPVVSLSAVAGSTFTINGTAASNFNPATLGVGNHTVAVTTINAAGCSVSATRTIAVNPVPVPSLAFLAPAYCLNATAVALPGGSGGNLVNYSINGVLNQTTFDPAALGVGTHTIKVLESTAIVGGCMDSTSRTITVNAVPAPAFTNLNASYCQNEGVVTLASNLAGSTFTINGVAATSLDPAALAVGNHTVVVSNTNTSNCTGTATQTITIKPVPTANFGTLAMTYCQNEPAVSLNIPGSTFTVNGAAAATFDPAALGVGSHTVSVTTTSTPDNCSVTATRTVTINAIPAPSLAFLNSSYCANDAAVNLPAAPTGSTTTFTVNGAPLTTAFDPATLGAGTHTVVLMETNSATGCVGTVTKIITINGTPLTDQISGPVSVCPGLNGVTYQIVTPRETTYQWTVSGGTLVSGQGTTAIVVNWGAASAATITATPVNTLGCSGTPGTLAVTVNPVLVTSQPVGQLTICQNQATQIRYVMPNPTVGSTFVWTVPGATVTMPAGNTRGDTIFATWTTPGTYNIVVRENSTTGLANCFGDSNPLSVTVLPSPDANLTIAGPLSVCENETNIAYNLTGAPATSTYAWSVTFNGTTTALPGTSSNAAFNAGTAGQYTLSVTETNASNCVGTPITKVITVTTKPELDSISGPKFVCPENLKNHLYSVKGTPGSEFDWQVIGGSFSPTTNDSIYVNWDNTTTKSIIVTPRSATGCAGSPFTLNVTNDPANLVLETVTTAEQNDQVIVLNFRMQSNSANRQDIDIYRREIPSGIVVKAGTVANTATNFTDNSVNTKEMQYEYYLESTNQCGSTLKSPAHNQILLSKVSGNEKAKSVELQWNAYRGWGANGVKEYAIYLKADNGSFEWVGQATDTTALLKDISGRGFNQCYRIKAISMDGRVSWSNEKCLSFANELAFYNIFTPNNDTRNDYFVVENIQLYPGNELSIFNRWGKEVYRKKDYDNKWDGKDVADGTYYYFMKLPNGKTYKGWVEIVR